MGRFTSALAVVAGVASVAHACVSHGGFQFEVPCSAQYGAKGSLGAQALTKEQRVVLETPSNVTAKANLRHYASTAHMAGTQGDLDMARFTQAKMIEFGLVDSVIHEQPAFLNYPVSRSLELVDTDSGQTLYRAALIESELEMDPTSNTEWRNMSFLAYGPSGLAEAELVFANYGRPEDFATLEAAGVDVAGKLVIVRYGECFRGLKAMNAQHRGAVGVVIYSDPADDGYTVGPVYPSGPWRPSDSIQRGSAQFNSLCAGDPARPNVEELCGYSTKQLIPQIPVLPISYGDAVPLFKALKGRAAPAAWVGGLADQLEYRLGPSHSKVRLEVNNTFTTTPIWNVITTVKGELDTPVVLSNHRDAWVFGSADPNSGSAVMLEVARSIGKLVKSGWKPKRTIIFGSWSGEEYGLLGSTGWAEEFAKTKLKKAVALLNTDVGVSGTAFNAQASPSLARTIGRALSLVADPVTGQPLSQVWSRKVGTLGSGSDYTVFLDHLGIPSMDISFSPSNGKAYGVYHSIYDSYTWIETQVDPFYELHTALAKVLGLLVLDFADAPLVPISPSDLGEALSKYVGALPPAAASLDLGALGAAVAAFQQAASAFAERLPGMDLACANEVLGSLERAFLDPAGLPRRKWFKHILQSPGFFLGYAAEVFPGIQQALSDKDLKLAQKVTDRVARIIGSAGSKLAHALCQRNAAAISHIEELQ